MNQQWLPFFEDLNDALRTVVQTLGGAKRVGQAIRPDLGVDAASRWVLDCLNADRRERFTPDQAVLLLMQARAAGFHAAFHYLCDELGYQRAAPIEPRDEQAELLRREEHLLAELKSLLERRERLARAPLQAVR